MTPYDTDLVQQITHLRQQAEALRLSLPAQHPGCSCSEEECCSHHANVWNGLLDVEGELQDALRALEYGAWQAGQGPRPAWYKVGEDLDGLVDLLDGLDSSAFDRLDDAGHEGQS